MAGVTSAWLQYVYDDAGVLSISTKKKISSEMGAIKGAAGVTLDVVTTRKLTVEPDASSAIYWWAAAAMIPGARVCVPIPAQSVQPDLQALTLLEHMGATVERRETSITVVGPPRLEGAILDAESCPDAAVMLAVVCAHATGPSRINGLHTLRVKETDRIHALACELGKTGCGVVEHPDAIEIDPRSIREGPIQVQTWNDHRIAMAFGILGLVRPGVRIEDPGCVGKSYPGFWADRASLVTG